MTVQSGASKFYEPGDIVKETGAIYAGKLPVTKDRPQEMGVFVVLPPDGKLVCSFNALNDAAERLNKEKICGDVTLQVPSVETMLVIIGNRNKGELKKIFDKYGLNTGKTPEGYLWTDAPGPEGKPQKVGEKKDKTEMPGSFEKLQIRPSDMDIYHYPKWTGASGMLVYLQPV
ncbi:MAG: hypothetical protein V1721_03960 [Pseudomonadota bacterium]